MKNFVQHQKVSSKLLRSRSELRTFFNQFPDLLCIIQPDGKFWQINLTWQRLLGWTPKALHSHFWQDLVHPEDVEASQKVMQQIQNNQVCYFTNRYRHQDESYRWLSWSVAVDENGYRYVVARIASPERIKLEPRPLWSETVAFKDKAIAWSIEKRTRIWFGLASVILVSLNVLSFLSFVHHWETTQRIAQNRVILNKLENTLSTVKDAETGQRGYLLTEQKSYLKPYYVAVKVINLRINELKQLVGANPEQQQQITILESLIVKKFAELEKTIELKKNGSSDAASQVVFTDDGQELMTQIRSVVQQLQSETDKQLKVWVREREEDNHHRQFLFSIGIVFDLTFLYLIFRAIQQEVVERQQAEALLKQLNEDLENIVQERTTKLEEVNTKLLHSNQELEQFAYIASHDLQEPLRAINSYAQLIAKKYQGNLDAKADKYINYIVEGALRMQQLINDLLLLSQIGMQGKALKPTSFEEVLTLVLDNLKIAIAESRAVITHDSLPTAMGDKTQLIQLLQNLIGNAIKFRREEPLQVHVSAVLQGKNWVFSVRDNGIGMKPEYFKHIFIIFQRLHSKSEYPGTGIGLAICRKIVERHGGHLWVESQLGEGTTFFFTILPIRQ